jgi:HlyD family secretion protein
MNKKIVGLIAVTAFLLASSLIVFSDRSAKSAAHASSVAQRADTPPLIAGPGRVEPISEDVEIGSELSGRLKSVNVEEGDHVHRGETLAVVENADYRAQVASAEANVVAKEAAFRKVVNGARKQVRSEAWASVREAQAVMDDAQSEFDRRQKLYAAGVISREELDRSARESDVAKARYEAAIEQNSLIDDHAREEDKSLAEADVQMARAQLAEAQASYDKSFIKSPLDGTILRKHHRTGESVSNAGTTPDPILTLGDNRILRVRVDVDEDDVSKVRLGQKAYVTADAYGKQRFWGRVVQVGEQLGPKNVRTDEPTERVDKKILETLVELEPGAQLPDGLRVDAFIVTDGKETTAAALPVSR